MVERFPALIALIVGHGPQARALRRLADELGLGDNVAFLGARTDVAVLDYLMDVFVLASRFEGYGMAYAAAIVETSLTETKGVAARKLPGAGQLPSTARRPAAEFTPAPGSPPRAYR